MAAFKETGLTVQPFKCGPDFIDPGLHQLVTGTVSRNLDIWMSSESFVRTCYNRHCEGADVAVVEGVMGMFDGASSSSGALAKALHLPSILVIDVRSMAESAAAIVKGFETLDPEVAPVGIILNRVASPRHLELVSTAIKQHCSAEILGYLPRSIEFSIPSRHLGLLTGDEAPIRPDALKSLSKSISKHIDLERILHLCRQPLNRSEGSIQDKSAESCTIAIARDKAFCFYYEDNFDLLRAAGAKLVFFSPLTDTKLPDNINAIYLGGGYPELYAKQLSRNQAMVSDIREWIEAEKPVYAECGGFMYLTQGIFDLDNNFYSMIGTYPVKSRMQQKRASLGYREVITQGNSCFGPKGTVLRGHEFHYSAIDEMMPEITRIYKVNNGLTEGYQYKKTLGGYMHLHFGHSLDAVHEFIKFCRE